MKRYILVGRNVRKVKEGMTREVAVASLKAKGHDAKLCNNPPTISTMHKWLADGIAKATDGCKVEPDGSCPHGHKSWLIALGYIG